MKNKERLAKQLQAASAAKRDHDQLERNTADIAVVREALRDTAQRFHEISRQFDEAHSILLQALKDTSRNK